MKFKNWFKNNSDYVSKTFATTFASLSIFIYLICVGTGIIDKNDKHLKPTDLGLVVVLLLINSDLLERLQDLKVDKDGLDFKLESKQLANVAVNQKETTALTYLGGVLLAEEKSKEEQKHFFDILLNDGDKDLLEDFYTAENEKKKLLYEKSGMYKNLTHLFLLGFVDKISHSEKSPIDNLAEKEDLREHFYLTDTGKKCLALGSSKTLQSSDINYYCQLKADRENMPLIATQN